MVDAPDGILRSAKLFAYWRNGYYQKPPTELRITDYTTKKLSQIVLDYESGSINAAFRNYLIKMITLRHIKRSHAFEGYLVNDISEITIYYLSQYIYKAAK